MRGTALLIEDEHSMGDLVRRYLEHEGYAIVWVRSGREGLAELDRHAIDVVILDIGLPDIDGFDVCRAIRARSSVPVLMLTARDEEADRVAGLEIGADDYVCKPFSPRELVARIKALLRRADGSTGPPSGRLAIADVVIDAASREVVVAGAPVELTLKEFDLLHCLAENAGVVLSRDVLLDRVWDLEYPGGTRTVDVHIAQLRRKLGRPDMIATVYGSGYKLVRPAPDSSALGGEPAP